MAHKCNYCDKEFANLPAHVKNVHPEKYKKGKRAESYGKAVPQKTSTKTAGAKSPKQSKSKSSSPRRSAVSNEVPRGVFRAMARNPSRGVQIQQKATKAGYQLELASTLKAKGQKLGDIALRRTMTETQANKTPALKKTYRRKAKKEENMPGVES